jgi:hypothetical protein
MMNSKKDLLKPKVEQK